MHLLTPTGRDLRPAELVAWLRVAPRDPLTGLRGEAPGEARRTAVFDRMRGVTASGAESVLDALRGELAVRGITDDQATVALEEQLWLDGSATVRIRATSEEAERAVREVVAARGGALLDAASLPGGDAAARTETLHDLPSGEPVVDAPVGRQWFSTMLGFDAAHERGLVGDGVRVAVVDSGVDVDHPELVAAMRRGDRHDRFPGVPVRSGHGTFVAGILAGRNMGLAPGVDLTSSRTYGIGFGDHAGAGQPTRRAQRVNAIRALQDAAAPRDGRRGADILVTSWGILDAPGAVDDAYDQAMATLAAAGIVVVAAAGNDGDRPGGSLSSPAQLDDVLTVGGVDRALAWHPKASTGPSPRGGAPKPDLAAPVVDIRSTSLGGGLVDTSTNPDRGFAGTSAGAPVAAALVALLTQAVHDHGQASPVLDEVRSVLPLLVRDVDAPGVDARTGAGVVDAHRIEDAARRIVNARHGIAVSVAR